MRLERWGERLKKRSFGLGQWDGVDLQWMSWLQDRNVELIVGGAYSLFLVNVE